MSNCDKWYKCRISDFSVNAYGGCGRIHEVSHTQRDIISLARDAAGKHGTSLEEFIGIKTIDDGSGEYPYERKLSVAEEFSAALEYLTHDGHIFEVEVDE